MSARDPLNLRRGWSGALRRPGKQGYRRKFWVAAENCEWTGDTTANGQRKGVSNSWSGNSEAARTGTFADTGNEQQFRVKRTQGTRWSVMFQGWIEVVHSYCLLCASLACCPLVPIHFKIGDGRLVTNVYAKSKYDRLRIDRALGFESLITTRKRSSRRTTFVAIIETHPGPRKDMH